MTAASDNRLTNIEIESYSPGVTTPASNEKRMRLFSGPEGFLEEYAKRLPVLRFLGIDNSLGF